ncbi:MAG: DNA polymerase III subunit alpha [Holosporales bacterium]|nr:DNA polymerase III subunit alpha [Holosporales bacterium]
MSDRPFIHLRTHSAYSLCEGAVKVDELVYRCEERQMPAVSVTDTNNLFGVMEFSEKCASHGIQPIPGTLLDIRYDDVIAPIVLLAKNRQGYKNLLKLMTCFYIKNNDDPRSVSMTDLAQYKDGIVAFSGGARGPVGHFVLDNNVSKANECLKSLGDIYKNNLYIEISRTDEPGEIRTENMFIEFAMQNDIPLVATNEVFFLDQSMHTAHDALLCIADSTYVTVKDRRKVSKEHYLKSTEEMYELFKDLKEAVVNTAIIAKRCSFFPEKIQPILPRFTDGPKEEEIAELDRQARVGLATRMKTDVPEEYTKRLDYELDLIKVTGFSGYFLLVSDFVKWAKEHDIPVGPGRGSGAGSLVAWSLFITDLDPIRYNLIFERFINPERISMPDFDIDFCQDRRDEVINYVRDKYGIDKVAHIITFGKLQARAVLRDVGRVIQMPYGLVDKISKLIPQNQVNPVDLEQAIEIEPQLKQKMKEDESIAFLVNLGLQLEGLYRHASLHAAGVVIGNESIDELVPLYSDGETELAITQINMKYIESAGLVKFDFLGLKTLTVIKAVCDYIKGRHNIEFDISQIPLDDEKTFTLLCSTDVSGVFQLESAGMRDAIQKLQPDNIEDIIALVALYRPGPMDNIPTYIARKHSNESIEYIHPILEPILKNTYGIMIYQEQVMKTAQEMGGYSLAAADILRRAMGKKIKNEMDRNKPIFIDGAAKKDVPREIAEQVFALMEKFAGYGFNRSHAAGYGLISYQTAYLKANYRLEFYLASMNIDIVNIDKIAIFVQDARQSGINILPPDVNLSEEYFIGEDGNTIRYALGCLKGCGVSIMKAIADERHRGGKFNDIFDFFKRTKSSGISSRQIEILILSGALDSIHQNRRQILESLDQLQKLGESIDTSQRSLFAGYKADTIDLKDVQEWNVIEKLDLERKSVGFYLSSHPMDIYSEFLQKFRITRSKDFEKAIGNVTVAGILLAKKEKLSKNGQKYAFLTISDQDNSFEVTIFPTLYATSYNLLAIGEPIIIDADIKVEADNIKLLGSSIKNIDLILEKQKVYIYISENADTDLLQKTIEGMEDGQNEISFIVTGSNGKKTEIETGYKKDMSIMNRRLISSITGVKFSA